MKVIVTGGAGFIGSHVVDAYVAAGHKVVVIDDLSTGNRKNINKKAKFYKADITDAALMDRIFKKERPEAVNHHAAFISVVESVKNPSGALTTNIMGTLNVLVAFGRHKSGKGKFIFSSTGGAMYNNPKKFPASEAEKLDPMSPYGLSKKIDELLIEYYSGVFGFNYTVFRYANVYGPRQNPMGEAGVVAIFTGLMKKGKQPIIFGNGKKTRDYVYVGDVAKANLLALKNSRSNGKHMNIGTGVETKDIEVFDAVASAVKYKDKPNFAPVRPGEIYRMSLNASLAKRILGWAPKTEFRKGIAKTVKEIAY